MSCEAEYFQEAVRVFLCVLVFVVFVFGGGGRDSADRDALNACGSSSQYWCFASLYQHILCAEQHRARTVLFLLFSLWEYQPPCAVVICSTRIPEQMAGKKSLPLFMSWAEANARCALFWCALVGILHLTFHAWKKKNNLDCM